MQNQEQGLYLSLMNGIVYTEMVSRTKKREKSIVII